MALIVGCDICGKYLKTVPWERRSEITQIMSCPDCERKKKALESYIQKAKNRLNNDIAKIFNEAENELQQMITEIASQNKTILEE